jgi:hypothetical protein
MNAAFLNEFKQVFGQMVRDFNQRRIELESIHEQCLLAETFLQDTPSYLKLDFGKISGLKGELQKITDRDETTERTETNQTTKIMPLKLYSRFSSCNSQKSSPKSRSQQETQR